MRRRYTLQKKGQSKVSPNSEELAPRPFAAQAKPEEVALIETQKLNSNPADFSILEPQGGRSLPLQPKLTIGAPNDPYEQEADRVAAQVVQQIHAPKAEQAAARAIQRENLPEEELQMKSDHTESTGGGEASQHLESAIHSARNSGQPLDPVLQQQMGQAMNADFGDVKVHTDNQADQLSQLIQAEAFTTGQDIFFRQGAYQPKSQSGQEVLAHELTHVIQQGGSSSSHIQRLPTRLQVTAEVGSPKKKEGMSERYKAFLNALDGYGNEIMKIVGADTPTIKLQQAQIFLELDKVIDAAAEYNKEHKSDERARLVAAIGQQARLEKVVVKTRAQYFINNPTAARPMWSQVIPKEMGTRVVELTSKTLVGADQGGINTVDEHQISDTYTGFFKEDKSKITNTTEASIADQMGISRQGPRFADRAVAMYRLDQLLQTNVVSRTDYAIKKSRFSSTVGTISQKAKGTKFAKLGNSGQVVKTDADKAGATNPDTFSFDDPVFQRCLSKLTIIDALCYQVDRHAGNFYVETDGQGRVVSVTGIDNDLAFPGDRTNAKHKKVTSMYREYAGIGHYADKEVAEMVLALDENDLRAVLHDLLNRDEIDLTIKRLRSLKAELATAKAAGRLLNPNQWDAATALQEEQSRGGYIADNRRKV